MKKRRWIVLTILLTSGCGLLQTFWDKEFVGVVCAKYPQGGRQKNDLAEVLNHWLGQLKSERIRNRRTPGLSVCPSARPKSDVNGGSPWVTSSDEYCFGPIEHGLS